MSTSQETFVPSLLGQCHSAAQTGLLTITSGDTERTIHFTRGNIVFASTKHVPDPVSQKLLEQGMVREKQIKIASEMVDKYPYSLGQLLVDLNLVDKNALKEFSTACITDLIYSMFSWKAPRSEFIEKDSLKSAFDLSFSTPEFIMQGIRKIDDMNRIHQMIGDQSIPLCFRHDPNLKDYLNCLDFEEAFLVSFFEQGALSVNQVLEAGTIPEATVLKTVCALRQAGLLVESESYVPPATIETHEEIVEPSSLPSGEYPPEMLEPLPVEETPASTASGGSFFEQQQAAMEFCYRLETKLNSLRGDSNHYAVLELDRETDGSAIHNAYLKLSEEFNLQKADQLTAMGLDLKSQFQEVISAIDKAYDILSNPFEKQNYDFQINKNMRRESGKFLLPDTPKVVMTTTPDAPLRGTSGNLPPIPSMPTPPSGTAAPSQPPPQAPLQAAAPGIFQPTSVEAGIMDAFKSLTATDCYLRSFELSEAKQYEQAVAALRLAVNKAPKKAEFWAQLGRVYTKMPQKQKLAEAAYKEAIQLDPQEPDYYTELGMIYQKFGMNGKALEHYQKALDIDPDNYDAKQAMEGLPQPKKDDKPGGVRGFLSKLGFNK